MKKHTFLIYGMLWLLLIASTFYQQMTDTKNYAQAIATRQAEMFFDHIVLLRHWNALHGGVYVPISDDTQPNPYQKLPERDLETKDGHKLTLINPAYMTPQIGEIEQGKTGIRFHITSRNPLRPENKPDSWELSALLAFTKGEASLSEAASIDGVPFYRYMAPLKIDNDCLKCHAQQGVKAGGYYGGLSISIPAGSIDEFVSARLRQLEFTHIGIALAGLVVLLVAFFTHQKMTRRLAKAKRHLQLAYMDVLTQLPNRRYYDFFVNREWKRAMRQGYPLSMIMIDIDYFKIYNDKMGHIQGDHCLQHVAKTMRRYFRRAGDLIARYGGEEFCVVAACDTDQIAQLAEILRKSVEDMQLPHPGSKISSFVTISLGAATVVPDETMEFEELLRRADQSLYLAKENGRNRVESYKV
ncbi:MAG: diguanylate cyclase [Methylococcaceae bacterium]|nr:diguanylate cyclase [Methylococcaceae bacterium]